MSPPPFTQVLEAAATTLTPVVLELGGKDAFIVLEDADLATVGEQEGATPLVHDKQWAAGAGTVADQPSPAPRSSLHPAAPPSIRHAGPVHPIAPPSQ